MYSKYDQEEFEGIGDMEKGHSMKDPLIIHTVSWVYSLDLLRVFHTPPSSTNCDLLSAKHLVSAEYSLFNSFNERLLFLSRFRHICRTAGRVTTWRS